MHSTLESGARRADDARRGELDGLRAIAVTLVFLYHAVPAAPALADYVSRVVVHLNIGVQIFFVLSGFLIYGPFARAHVASTRPPTLAGYAVRRALRIYPAYLVALAVMGGLGWITFTTHTDIVTHATLTYLYFPDRGHHGGLTVSWSLVAEVTFYVLVPIWAALMRRAAPADPLRAEWRGALALVAVGYACIWIAAYVRKGPVLVTFFMPTLAPLGSGMALAVLAAARDRDARVSRGIARLQPLLSRSWILALACFLILCLPPRTSFLATPGQQFWHQCWQTPIALLLVAPAALITPERSRFLRVLALRPVTFVGTVSYGFYLWHNSAVVGPVSRLGILATANATQAGLVLVAMYALAVAVGSASYALIERPCLRLAQRWSATPATSPDRS